MICDNIWAIILGGGAGTRLAALTGNRPKQFLEWRARPLYWHSVLSFARAGRIQGIILALPQDFLETEKERLQRLQALDAPGIPIYLCAGGNSRQDSSSAGMRYLPDSCTHVLIHDAARPFIKPGLIRNIAQALDEGKTFVVPGISTIDTIKRIGRSGEIIKTLPRDQLRCVQTPQGFKKDLLIKAQQKAEEEGIVVTDDASLLEQMGERGFVIEGDPGNIKITTPEDMRLIAPVDPEFIFCTGIGYDVHRYGNQRPLKLGGIDIPADVGVIAHSDGDVLLHALMDAILGCAGLGDIGRLFPDSDLRLDNISSAVLLDRVLELASSAGLKVCNVDLIIVAQKPKLASYAATICSNVARLLNLDTKYVNFKATTEEGLGFTGSGEGIKAWATVSARRPAWDTNSDLPL